MRLRQVWVHKSHGSYKADFWPCNFLHPIICAVNLKHQFVPKSGFFPALNIVRMTFRHVNLQTSLACFTASAALLLLD